MPDTKSRPRGMWPRLKRYLLAGIIVTAPAFLSIYIIIFLVNLTDRWAKSLLPARVHENMAFFGIPGVGILCLLLLLIIIGRLATSWLGHVLVSLTDRFFTNTPVLRTFYTTMKQLFQTVLGENTNSFRQVVLVEFPRADCWSIGFITGESEAASESLGEELQFVFIPTTPNPTNGYLVLLAKSQIKSTAMTVEQGLKAVVSMGMSQ